MFLIVMLSFAIVSEVSAAAVDDAEPGESGLNADIHPTDSHSPGERLSVEDVNTSHSNNDQTSQGIVPVKTPEQKILYEHKPAGHEKMDNLQNIVEFAKINSSAINNDLIEDITSKLIGLDNVSVILKNDERYNSEIPPKFNGVLPQNMENIMDFYEFNDPVGNEGDLIQFDVDLSVNASFIYKSNISISNNELPKIGDNIVGISDNNSHFHVICIFPLKKVSFLPKINETQDLDIEHT